MRFDPLQCAFLVPQAIVAGISRISELLRCQVAQHTETVAAIGPLTSNTQNGYERVT